MNRITRIRHALVAGLCAAGIATGAGLAARATDHVAHAGPSLPAVAPAAAGLPANQISDVAERVVESVVNISTTQNVQQGPFTFDPFWNDPDSPAFGQDGGRRAHSLGSGVIVSADGRILTNAHVVDKADEIRVTLPNGDEVTAEVIGADPRSDVAVLQLVAPRGGKLPALRPLPMGDSSKLRLGAVVLAVGNPFGVGQGVTMGIVSAVGRASVGIEEYEDFIQTDAAINPGNSGGALVDLEGNLVGINTAILSRSGGYQGIGFAIPTNMARPIMEALIKDGRVSRGYLGVQLTPLNQDTRDRFQLKAASGVVVAGVGADTPAARAGLKPGDVVTAIDGTPVRELGKLRNLVAMKGAGKVAELAIVRGGVDQRVAVTLGELPDQRRAVAAKDAQPQPNVRRFRIPRGAQPGQGQGQGDPDDDARNFFRGERIIINPDGTVERQQINPDGSVVK